jgi:hypothetical protein
MSNFRIGEKVVCIDGRKELDRGVYYDETFPQEGCVYTVRGLDSGVLLEEIVNEPQEYVEGLKEVSFRSERFRLST